MDGKMRFYDRKQQRKMENFSNFFVSFSETVFGMDPFQLLPDRAGQQEQEKNIGNHIQDGGAHGGQRHGAIAGDGKFTARL